MSTVFPVPFYFLVDAHLAAYSSVLSSGATTQLVLGTDYTAQGAGTQSGGSITLTSPLAIGRSLYIGRNVPIDQQVDYTPNDKFPAQTTENALDKLTMIAQQIAADKQRSVRFPVYEQTDGALPQALTRAGMVYGFDQLGAPIMVPIPASVGAGDIRIEEWVDGVDYVSGVSNSVTLSREYGVEANLGTVVMQGVPQDPQSYTLAGTTLLFDSVIPAGVSKIWCYGGTTLSLAVGAIFVQDMGGAVTRSYLNKMRDLVSISDFGETPTAATFLNAVSALQAAGGGLLRMGGISAISPPSDFHGVLLEYDGPNVPTSLGGEPLGTSNLAQKVFAFQDNTAHVGKAHSAVHISNSVFGSGGVAPANADFGLTVSVLKQNPGTTTQGGEVDGIYVFLRNGGPNSDSAAILGDVANYGTGLNQFFESNTHWIQGDTVVKTVNVQCGVVDTRTGNQYGLILGATAGALTTALLMQSLSPASGAWQDFIQGIYGTAVVFRVDGTGQIHLQAPNGAGGAMSIYNNSGPLAVSNNAGTVISSLNQNGDLTLAGAMTFGSTLNNIVFSGAVASGASTPALGASKPGSTTGAGPATWMNVKIGGSQYWVPAWAN